MRKRLLAAMATLLTGLVACGGGAEPPARATAEAARPAAVVSSATAVGDTVQYRVAVNGRSFGVDHQVQARSFQMVTAAEPLSADEIQAVHAHVAELEAQTATKEAAEGVTEESERQRTLAALVARLVKQGPVLHLASRASVNMQQTLLEDRATAQGFSGCTRKGQRVWARWSDRNFKAYAKQYTVGENKSRAGGDYRCMGSCGPGCEPATGTRQRSTLACGNHDWCSYTHLNTQTGSSDADCNSEFEAAIADVLDYQSRYNACTAW